MGDPYFSRRMRLQVQQVAWRLGGHRNRLFLENINFIPVFLRFILKYSGFLHRAEKNALDFKIEQQQLVLPGLAEVFNGYRILQLSDLHIDFMLDGGERLKTLLADVEFNLCVITGDFRFRTSGVYQPAVDGMKSLLSVLQCDDGIVAILGNHDYLECVPGLESRGIKMLLNEAVAVERKGEKLWIVGVDDPHYYEVDDLERAVQPVPANDVMVLLAHSPEIIAQAAGLGVGYYLCGHTHGGQVCLPGRIPVMTNARCRRKQATGRWEYRGMPGYTSRGTGTSGLPVRIFCPPEVTIHHLYSENGMENA